MNLPQLTICDFENIDAFKQLQRKFLLEDFHYDPQEPYLKEIDYKGDFYIGIAEPYSVKVGKNYVDNYTIEKYYFQKNYLKSVIKSLATEYVEDFYYELREDYMDDVKQRKNHILKKHTEVRNISDNLNQFNFLDKEIYYELLAQFLDIEKAIHNPTLTNDKVFKADRLTLKGWNETDLVTFFSFLRSQKVIDFISDAELGRFLERNFCVERKNGEVSFLDSLNKRLNDIKNTNKLNDRSEKRLYNLFQKINRF